MQPNRFGIKDLWPSANRFWGLVQVARSRGNTFLDVRPCCSGRKRCRNNAFRASVQGLYAAKCYLGLNQADSGT